MSGVGINAVIGPNFFSLSICNVKDSVGGVINVLNLMEVVLDKTDAASFGTGCHDYFHALCQQSFPGPLVGGNAGSRELNKWIDDKIANCETACMDFRRGDHLRLLFSLLKIACQYYGKLRSPFGTDLTLKVFFLVCKLFIYDLFDCLDAIPHFNCISVINIKTWAFHEHVDLILSH